MGAILSVGSNPTVSATLTGNIMILKDNSIAGILLNYCNRSNDLDMKFFGLWLERNGAVEWKPNESQEPTAGDKGSATV
jgi:hypothetical protein